MANLQMRWGQAPGSIYFEDPAVWGNIMPGDYVTLLMPKPDDNGVIRVKVHPHDGRAVGRTDNQVWIDWNSLTLLRHEHVMFTCEG